MATSAASSPWIGEPGTVGTVAVVGAGKMGLPLAAQFASHGWDVIAVDIDETVVESINEGRTHISGEPGLAELVAEAHAAGRLRATTDGRAASAEADVIILIVPVMLDAALQPDYRHMDAAATSVSGGVRSGATVIIETTLPVGDTRDRYAQLLGSASGLSLDRELFVAFSPERLFTGAVIRNLATYPKLVGGIGPNSDGPRRGLLRIRARRRDREDELSRGGGAQQACRYHLSGCKHRVRERAGRRTRGESASTSRRSSRQPTASRTVISTSLALASGDIASRSIRGSCWPGRQTWSWSSSRAGSTMARSTMP